jgi:hypothetical protein
VNIVRIVALLTVLETVTGGMVNVTNVRLGTGAKRAITHVRRTVLYVRKTLACV